MQKTHKIRDSIKVAKGKNNLNRTAPSSTYSSSQQTDTNTSVRDNDSFYTNSHSVRSDPAEAPFIPRFSPKGRTTALTILNLPRYWDTMVPAGVHRFVHLTPVRAPGAVVNNFFDAVGTMRMEAFISPLGNTKFDDFPDEQDEMDMISLQRRRSRDGRRRSRNKESFGVTRGGGAFGGYGGRAIEDWYSGSRTAGEEEYSPRDIEERSEKLGRDSRDDNPFSNF
ncbi:hypothetical protein EYC84_005885 [Monilinia fructicola]|nr:hypothetical protein EYC84_005885 [Monilinia fructicola]